MKINENPNFLKKQLLTYLGNKRKLVGLIIDNVLNIKKDLGKEKISFLDGFAGSGVVSRNMKQYCDVLYCNDLEKYSYVVNKTFLSNRSEIDEMYLDQVTDFLNQNKLTNRFPPGLIEKNYAPKDTNNIQVGERCFYTTENAIIIDNIRRLIEENVEEEYKCFLISSLLYKASIHNNTAGVFKGFYKSKETKIGKFGGDGENALKRIMGEITLDKIEFSNFDADIKVYKQDINKLVSLLPEVDIAYYDPPYNQHPYGSNYHILNTIINYNDDDLKDLSVVSGIPSNWQKSLYNKKITAQQVFENLIKDTKAKYILISYNDEGIIPIRNIEEILGKYGDVSFSSTEYNSFRGSRGGFKTALKNDTRPPSVLIKRIEGKRNLYVKEILWLLKKQ